MTPSESRLRGMEVTARLRDLRRQWFDADPTCRLCGKVIVTFTDATIDHRVATGVFKAARIPQWMRYALAHEEANLQLAHQRCNLAKAKWDHVEILRWTFQRQNLWLLKRHPEVYRARLMAILPKKLRGVFCAKRKVLPVSG